MMNEEIFHFEFLVEDVQFQLIYVEIQLCNDVLHLQDHQYDDGTN